jgi:hypothetical protein
MFCCLMFCGLGVKDYSIVSESKTIFQTALGLLQKATACIFCQVHLTDNARYES